jgi:hypothetical protein
VLNLAHPEDRDEVYEKLGPFLDHLDVDDVHQVEVLSQISVDTEEIIDLRKEQKIDREELEAVRSRNVYLESMLVAAGKAHLSRMKPKTFKSAVAAYLKSGTRATERTKIEYRNYLTQISEFVGPENELHKIEEEKYIEYLDSLKKRDITSPQVRKVSNILIAMLQNQSGGLYPVQRFKEWRKLNTGSASKSDEDFYWIDKNQVKRLAREVKKQFSDYWHDVVLIQFALALRPEEIPLLQSANVTLKKGKPNTIYISTLKDIDGKTIRRLKTARSMATLPISLSAQTAVKRRLKKNHILLFPRSLQELKIKEQPHKHLSEFEAKNQIWTAAGFCKHYLNVLRTSASTAKLDSDRIDCRTLRRSRGRDIILKTQSAEQAAVFLRDNAITVARFYSRWIPKDVKVD